MRLLIILLLTCLFTYAHAQKIYVWCPPATQVGNSSGKLSGVRINLLIHDARTIEDTTRVECNSHALKQAIANEIILAYPSAIVNQIADSDSAAKAEEGRITIRIGISAYHSASGTDVSTAIGNAGGNFNWGDLPKNRWNSVTGYHVVLEDFRNKQLSTVSRDIANIVSRPNIGGSLTAKKALTEAYTEANRELLYFIDTALAK